MAQAVLNNGAADNRLIITNPISNNTNIDPTLNNNTVINNLPPNNNNTVINNIPVNNFKFNTTQKYFARV